MLLVSPPSRRHHHPLVFRRLQCPWRTTGNRGFGLDDDRMEDTGAPSGNDQFVHAHCQSVFDKAKPFAQELLTLSLCPAERLQNSAQLCTHLLGLCEASRFIHVLCIQINFGFCNNFANSSSGWSMIGSSHSSRRDTGVKSARQMLFAEHAVQAQSVIQRNSAPGYSRSSSSGSCRSR